MEGPALLDAVIEVQPAEALVDKPVAVRLRGLPPGGRVVVKAEARLGAEPPWRSHAELVADGSGIVDLGRQAPEAGSYQGIEPMGLFWSMEPEPGASSILDLYSTLDPISVTLTAEVGGRAVASRSLRRLFMSPDVARTPVRENGLIGTLFHPSGGGPHPGVLVLGGSEGGLVESHAALLARHGYATLALAYFGVDRLPRNLSLIPLEYFQRAMRWMMAHPAVAGDRVAVAGHSRGGELALLVGATYPEHVAAVVGIVPGGVVQPGIARNNLLCLFRSSWTLAGKPVPFLPTRLTPRVLREAMSSLLGRPLEVRVFYDAAMGNAKALAAATIPVERIRGPVLLLSGADDRVWSPRWAEIASERLEAHRHPHPHCHVSYPACGHLIGLPNLPTVTSAEHPSLRGPMILGGTREGNTRASADAWSRGLAFLEEHLQSRSR